MTCRRYVLAAVLALPVLVPSCGDDKDPEPRSPAPQVEPQTPADSTGTGSASRQARAQFKALCVTCHGDKGKGDGAGAAAMDPKPRDFGDPTWQDSVTDEHIRTVILRGGAAVGKSAQMPPQPQLKSKPELLDALVKAKLGIEE